MNRYTIKFNNESYLAVSAESIRETGSDIMFFVNDSIVAKIKQREVACWWIGDAARPLSVVRAASSIG